MRLDYCGKCERDVPVRDDGSTPINDDGRTSQWVFVAHERGRVIQSRDLGPEPCPGEGRNSWETQHAL